MDYAASILARLPNRKRAIGLDRLVKKIREYLPSEQVAEVLEAYRFAEEAHHGQRRKTGEPYISHPVAVHQAAAAAVRCKQNCYYASARRRYWSRPW